MSFTLPTILGCILLNAICNFVLLLLAELVRAVFVLMRYLIKGQWKRSFVQHFQNTTVTHLILQVLLAIMHVLLRVVSTLFHTSRVVLTAALKDMVKTVLVMFLLLLLSGEQSGMIDKDLLLFAALRVSMHSVYVCYVSKHLPNVNKIIMINPVWTVEAILTYELFMWLNVIF